MKTGMAGEGEGWEGLGRPHSRVGEIQPLHGDLGTATAGRGKA